MSDNVAVTGKRFAVLVRGNLGLSWGSTVGCKSQLAAGAEELLTSSRDGEPGGLGQQEGAGTRRVSPGCCHLPLQALGCQSAPPAPHQPGDDAPRWVQMGAHHTPGRWRGPNPPYCCPPLSSLLLCLESPARGDPSTAGQDCPGLERAGAGAPRRSSPAPAGPGRLPRLGSAAR